MKLKELIIVCCFVFMVVNAQAGPNIMNYQGKLTDNGGAPVTSATNIEFTFWDAESGGNQLGNGFSDTDSVIPNSEGIYSTMIGDSSGNIIPEEVFSVDSVYLNVSVNGEDLTPRQRMTSAGFAFSALNAKSAESATSALNGIPAGYCIIAATSTPPAGFSSFGRAIRMEEKWATATSMPVPRYNAGACALNNKIYVAGGEINYDRNINAFEEYDPATDSWSTKTNMPTGRSDLTLAVVNNKIYAIGGIRYTSFLGTVEEYDPSTNSWETKTSMPTRRCSLTSGVVNGKIYVIGGSSFSITHLDTIEEYDPVTDSWATKTSMPTPRNSLICGVVNEKIYAIGGYRNSQGVNTVEEYDPSTDSWTVKTSMPIAKYTLACGVANEKIYAFGGYYQGAANTVEEYDPATDSWTTKANMITGRYNLPDKAPFANGNLYVIGGKIIDSTTYTINEYYSPEMNYHVFMKD